MSHKVTILFEDPQPIEKLVVILDDAYPPDEALIEDLDGMASIWGPCRVEIGNPDEQRIEEFNRIMEDLQMEEALDAEPIC
jgi:hypothetical protein